MSKKPIPRSGKGKVKSVKADELETPALFEEMNQDRIPKLESRGKAFLAQKDLVIRETEKRDAQDEEIQLIMADHHITRYKVNGFWLRLKQGKTKVEGGLGDAPFSAPE